MNKTITVNGSCIPFNSPIIPKDFFRSNFMITSVALPEHITEIDDYAFFNCQLLKTIVMSDNITRIGVKAFDGCLSLKEINIPKGVKVIETAFSGCEDLERVFIPEGVTTIKFCAFYCCERLSKVVIPDSVKIIENMAFGDCPKLVIECRKGSFAEQYAQSNGINYKII